MAQRNKLNQRPEFPRGSSNSKLTILVEILAFWRGNRPSIYSFNDSAYIEFSVIMRIPAYLYCRSSLSRQDFLLRFNRRQVYWSGEDNPSEF